jgi:hypothetical protein
MNVTEWETTFKPLPNHLDDNASWQDENGYGIMFETYGDEYEYVEQFKLERRVWSYRDDEYEGLIVVSGMAHNPIGYFITEVPWTDEDLSTIIYVEENNETV